MQKLKQELIELLLKVSGHEQPGFKRPVKWKVRFKIYYLGLSYLFLLFIFLFLSLTFVVWLPLFTHLTHSSK